MVCEPAVVEENVYVAVPFDRASEEVTVARSTAMVKVPVGVAVLELEADVTLMVIASFVPEPGVVVAAVSAVLEATSAGLTVKITVPLEDA